MNKRFVLLAAMSLLPGISYAQAAFDGELDQELAQVSANPQANAPASAAIAPQGSQNGSQPIYILNQATPTANAQSDLQQKQAMVQSQPQVNISASPLAKSKAEAIREARQQAEVDTENKIVEKLESSRMEDERRRASVLFDAPFNNLSNQQQQPIQPAVAPAPIAQPVVVQQVAPAPAPAPVVDKDMVREEVRAAMQSEQTIPDEVVEQKYFGASVGIGEYPDVQNVRGNYLLGVTFGTKFDETYAVEGSFTYGDYSVEPLGYGYWNNYGFYVPRLIDVHQYQGSMGVKYLFLNGVIKPTIGGVVAYSYREFSWSKDQYNPYGSGNQTANSHAIDIGTTVGADIQMGKKWSLGLDFKYMWNLASRVNTNQQSMFLTTQEVFGKPIEKLQYYTMTLSARANF